MTEEESIALGSCSNGKLQQKLWRWRSASASAARGPERLLAGAPAGAAGPARPWSRGYGTHPLTSTGFTLCTVPATATTRYRCLPVPCTLLEGGGSFFYCSTAPEALLFQVGCDCCFCWSGLSFWTGTENEETGMKCIDFLKHIYNVFQCTLIKDTTSEDHGLLFIPFTRLRTYCTLCNKDSDQSSCFCCNSSKLIGFITWSTGRVWNMLWGNKGSGNTFINMLTTSLECFCFPIISYCSKMCLLHCYHRNACAYLEYLIMIFHTKTFRSLKGKKLSLIQNNLASSRPFSCSQSGCSESVLQVHSCWPWI